MSQEVETKQRQPANSLPIQPWSVESDADKLMDDLFSDIDRILDGGSKLPTEPVQPEYVSLQPVVIPNLALPNPVSEPFEVKEEPGGAIAPITIETTLKTSPVQPKPYFDKILLGAACASLLGTLFLWLASQERANWSLSPSPAASTVAQQSPVSESDRQFIDYMRRSLEVIDRKATAQKSPVPTIPRAATNQPSVTPVPVAPVAPTAPTAPSVTPSTGASRPAASVAPGVLERVYIPVYQPPQVLPSASPAPRATISPTIPTPQSYVPPPNLAIPSVSPAQSSPAPAPAPKHTLVGLLELGDRSAALFEINGTTQRIQVGQAIGSSGWALVSVANGEAVIRRNGEVRSIYSGQKF